MERAELFFLAVLKVNFWRGANWAFVVSRRVWRAFMAYGLHQQLRLLINGEAKGGKSARE